MPRTEERAKSYPVEDLSPRQRRTRERLVEAARSVLASEGTVDLSIFKLTQLAGVSNGSFYNFFNSREELYRAALDDVLEEHGTLVDRVTEGMRAAEAFLTGLRLTVRLTWTNRQIAEVFVQSGPVLFEAQVGIIPRSRRDLQKAIDAGDCTVSSPDVGVAITTGALVGILHALLNHPEKFGEAERDEFCERVGAMLGMPQDLIATVMSRNLPEA